MKIYSISNDFLDIRIDKWIKLNICKVPQALIEKNLRNKNITVNCKKIRSSYKLKTNDKVYLKNFNPKLINLNPKKKFVPSKRDIKNSKAFIIEPQSSRFIVTGYSGFSITESPTISTTCNSLSE